MQTPVAYYGTAMRRKTSRQNPSGILPLRDLLKTPDDSDEFQPVRQRTAGRLARRPDGWQLENAAVSITLRFNTDPPAAPITDLLVHGALVKACGHLVTLKRSTGTVRVFKVDAIEQIRSPQADEPDLTARRTHSLADALEVRARSNRRIRDFFDSRDFLEVETPNWVPAAGTDIHLSPVSAEFQDPHRRADQAIHGHLHTSPEFSMKRLLAGGMERIWQMCKVWRNGEITPLHNPEFTLLEWYRAWEELDAIIEDVEDLSRALLGECAHIGEREISLGEPFARMTMQEVVGQACEFDILEAIEFESLLAQCERQKLVSEKSLERARNVQRWDELFFELQITYIDPFLDKQGAVFVTDWPTPLAVLARTNPEDARVAQRFELYIGGVELANGFQELTDPVEQRRRFEADLSARKEAGLPQAPMPERFLEALEWGLPPASGVAVGVDRYLMLKSGAQNIRKVAPFAMRRDPNSGAAQWR